MAPKIGDQFVYDKQAYWVEDVRNHPRGWHHPKMIYWLSRCPSCSEIFSFRRPWQPDLKNLRRRCADCKSYVPVNGYPHQRHKQQKPKEAR